MDNDIRNYPFYYAELVAIDGCEFLKLHGNKGIRHFPLPFKPYTFGWSDKQAKTEYRDAVTHQYIEKLEFETTGKVRQYGWNFTSWESDISYVRRFMLDMDLKITKPRIAYVDIETYDKDGVPNAETQKILCIGIVYDDGKEEYLSGDEKDMIETFVSRMENIGMIVTYNGGSSANHRDQKSGAMIFGGVWSSTAFDLPFIATRYEVLGLGSKHDFDVKLKHIDFVDLFITHRRETKRVGQSMAGGYSLDNVCKQVLGVGKIERKTKVADMSPTDLMEYNMRDIRILKQFDEKMKYTALRIGLAQASNSCLVRWQKNHKYDELSPLIMIDNLCIRECNKRGLRCKAKEIGAKYGKFVGAYVKEPKMGIYKGVQNYDFMQLYPSIMIRDKISFDRDGVVVPEILKFLMAERKKLKERYLITKSDEDYIMQYAYKVLANSIYGAYGSPYFRFYDEGKAQQITLAGQKLLKDMIKMVESMAYNVQYGDSVLGDTPIWLTNRGGNPYPIMIKDLIPASYTGSRYPLHRLKIWNGKKFSDIKYAYKHKVTKRGYRILTKGAYIECTEDHSLIIDGKEVSPKNLKVGDVVEMGKSPRLDWNNFDHELAWLFGFFIAEGTCGKYGEKEKSKTNIRIVQKERRLLDKCARILYSKLAMETTLVNYNESSGVYGLNVRNPAKFIDYFRAVLYKRNEKCVPNVILHGRSEVKRAFLHGLYEGDGGFSNRERRDMILDSVENGISRIEDYGWVLDQKHKLVIEGVCKILEDLGKGYSLNVDVKKPSIIRIRINKKMNDDSRNVIKKITPFDIDDYVYDVETKSHDFSGGVGGVHLHNTDSIFVDIEKDKSKIMAELINKEFDPINVEVGEYYESIIFVGTEQRGTKKRYTGLYIEDGKEKITTKGFEYIKRDFTVAGKEIMMSLVNNILHGATYTEVMKMFEAFKIDLRSGKHDDKLIMAKGVKNLNEYVYKEGHSGAPHVRALRKLIKMGHAQPLDIHYVFTKPKKVKEVDPVTKVAKVVLEDTEPIIGDVIPKGLDYDRYVEQVKRVLMQLVRPLAKSEGLVLGKKGSASHSLDVYISS